MKKTYIYLHHCGWDFYLTNYELKPEERYCSFCDEYDELIGVYYNKKKLKESITALRSKKLSILPWSKYNTKRTK